MLELGSAFEDETLTIRLVTLENPEIFSRKYPAAHLDEITTNLPFSDSRRKRVKSSHCGLLDQIEAAYQVQWIISFHLLHWKHPQKHPKIFYGLFCEKNIVFFGQKI